MPQSNSHNLAEKIARILDAESDQPDMASIQAALDKISERLDKLEQAAVPTPASVTEHPSQSRFAVIEAIADQVFGGEQKEKACTFEPNGRPCDHCSMCSSRGF
jgi:hypothetical protein